MLAKSACEMPRYRNMVYGCRFVVRHRADSGAVLGELTGRLTATQCEGPGAVSYCGCMYGRPAELYQGGYDDYDLRVAPPPGQQFG